MFTLSKFSTSFCFLIISFLVQILFAEIDDISVSSEVERMLQQNPLIANMPMFQDISSENVSSTSHLLTEIQRASTKRSSDREIVSDNFGDEEFRRMNSSLFDEAQEEPTDIEFRYFRDFRENGIEPTGRALSDEDDDEQLESSIRDETTEQTVSTSTRPFEASESLFETTIAQASLPTTSPTPFTSATNMFARSSPYFQSFTSTPASTFSTTSEASDTEEEKFFVDENVTMSENELGNEDGENEEEEVEEGMNEGVEDGEIDDISTIRTLENYGITKGIPKATFRGSSYIPLKPLSDVTTEMPEIFQKGQRRDENEVVQFNGKYSVSATKYYVDNRIDGEHYEIPRESLHDNQFEKEPIISRAPSDLDETRREVDLTVDPFAVEKEVRKVARMRAFASKTSNSGRIEIDEFSDGKNEQMEDYRDEEEPIISSNVKMERKNGKDVETRENVYRGKMTKVSLWNKYLHGHDILRYPGAIFDDNFGKNHRKSGIDRAFSSKNLLSNSDLKELDSLQLRHFPRDGEGIRRVVAGVANIEVPRKIKSLKFSDITDDVQSVCFNTKDNVAVTNLSPFESLEQVSKLECLTRCAKSHECYAVTFSSHLAVCAMFDSSIRDSLIVRSQGHSFHKKLDQSTLKCLKMFTSRSFLHSADGSEEYENSPSFLRLVEKDGHYREQSGVPNAIPPTASSASPLFPSTPRCTDGEDIIFVRSDSIEASNPQNLKSRSHLIQITEDDCVFACLTNTRPGGGKQLDCVAVEYDKLRGLCFLMTQFPGDVAMTPKPVNPVNVYEKICVQQSTANQCSGGQPSRFRQKVLIGHLVDAHSVESAAECINLCVSKKSIGCVSAMFYSTESTLNCILNDQTHRDDPSAFFEETAAIVDYFSIEDCLGIPEVEQRIKREKIEKMKRKMKKLKRLRRVA